MVLRGGMIRGGNVLPIRGMAGYIQNAIRGLEEMTGVKQAKAYHGEIPGKGTYITNSGPPAIAP